MRIPSEIKNIVRNIKLVLMDVDGTLTDGKLYILPSGEEIKGYDVKDGAGIVLAQRVGIRVGIITGKVSENVLERAKRLKITDVYTGVFNKLPILKKFIDKYDLKENQICYIGDDIGDYNIMKKVGFPVAVKEAHYKIKEISKYRTEKPAGGGAVREVFDMIFEAQNLYDEILDIFNKEDEWIVGFSNKK